MSRDSGGELYAPGAQSPRTDFDQGECRFRNCDYPTRATPNGRIVTSKSNLVLTRCTLRMVTPGKRKKVVSLECVLLSADPLNVTRLSASGYHVHVRPSSFLARSSTCSSKHDTWGEVSCFEEHWRVVRGRDLRRHPDADNRVTLRGSAGSWTHSIFFLLSPSSKCTVWERDCPRWSPSDPWGVYKTRKRTFCTVKIRSW